MFKDDSLEKFLVYAKDQKFMPFFHSNGKDWVTETALKAFANYNYQRNNGLSTTIYSCLHSINFWTTESLDSLDQDIEDSDELSDGDDYNYGGTNDGQDQENDQRLHWFNDVFLC